MRPKSRFLAISSIWLIFLLIACTAPRAQPAAESKPAPSSTAPPTPTSTSTATSLPPSPEPTGTSTSTLEATATAEARSRIDSQELLSSLEDVISIKTNGLVGKAVVEGEVVSLDFPQIHTPKMSWGLTANFQELPRDEGVEEIYGMQLLPPEGKLFYRESWAEYFDQPDNEYTLEETFGITPEDWGPGINWEETAKLQLTVFNFYGHYRAWQHDHNDRYLRERKDTTFMEYLSMLNDPNSDFDGGHLQIVRSTNERLYEDEEPTYVTPSMDVIVAIGGWDIKNEPIVGGIISNRNTLYDPVTQDIMFLYRVHGTDVASFSSTLPHHVLLLALQSMSWPLEAQGQVFNNQNTPGEYMDELRRSESEFIDMIYHENLGSRGARFAPMMFERDWR